VLLPGNGIVVRLIKLASVLASLPAAGRQSLIRRRLIVACRNAEAPRPENTAP
jgi:hypothetical protein